MITELATSIKERYDSSLAVAVTLRAANTGGLYFVDAKQDVPEPYTVFTFAGAETAPYFGSSKNAIEKVNVQFNVYSKARDGLVEAGDIQSKLDAVFNGANLSYTTFSHLIMERSGYAPVLQYDDVTQVTLLYQAWYERNG